MDKSQMAALAAKMIEATRAFVSKSEVSINAKIDERFTNLLDRVQQMVDISVTKAVVAVPPAKPGRDALEIEPLVIDERKSYQRGTWASYNNGLIRATRTTDPLLDGNFEKAGWAVVVEGVAAIVVNQGQDERSFEVATMLTSGVRMVSEFFIPAVSDAGLIRTEVDKAVATLPKPKDGESVDFDVLDETIKQYVQVAVAALPKPKDGKDADAQTVRNIVLEAVNSISLKVDELNDRVKSMIEASVASSIAALPKPKNGTSVTIDDVRPLVDEAVAALPKPKDGTSVTIDEVLAALPKPKDGTNVTIDDVRPIVAEAVAALPKPKDGTSVTLDDVRSLVAEAAAALPKPKDGESIHPDTVLLMVRDTVDKAVSALPRPKDGEPGRDAVEMRPLPSIDETRSYPVGTYAKHNGGEIRAERRTDPVKNGDILASGWTVAREGLASVAFVQGEDPREVTCAMTFTGGTKTNTVFKVPMVLDLGVWREGEYQKGDHVSYDGSGWIAQRATTAKPGTSPDWRLSTKRGRDGKDVGEPITQRNQQVRIK